MKYFIKFKDDYINRLNESDSFEKIAGFGFALFVIIVAILVPEEQRQNYSKYIMMLGVIILYQNDLNFSPKVAGKYIIKGASFFSVLCF